MPNGVDNGIKGMDLRGAKMQLFPAIYFSGPCYCGVVSRWYDVSTGQSTLKTVPLPESFALGLIASGVTALFAGLDPDRGESNSQEYETLLTYGSSLGDAIKSTYDEVTLGYRREPFSLCRHAVEGKPAPKDSIFDTMLTGAACRVLLGDPTVKPFEKSMAPIWKTSIQTSKTSLTVSAEAVPELANYWYPINIFHNNGSWTHQVRFTVDLTEEQARGLKGIKEVTAQRGKKELTTAYQTAGLETWLGRYRLHLLAVFPHTTYTAENRALWGGGKISASFTLEREPAKN